MSHPKKIVESNSQSVSRRDPGFGARVRRLRTQQGLTLQEVSDRSGLAASTVSKVEQGKLSPTYENLLRLAEGLRADLGALFGDAPTMPALAGRRSVTRAGQGARLETAQYNYELLAAELSHKKLVPLRTILRARSLTEFPDYVRHDGEEFLYVLSGTVELLTEGYAPLRLAPGDSCYFDSVMGHACLSVGETEATILWVCSHVTLALPD
jgi:transcriptional regulator with XRE-family HTH domain